jgi:hypothetical protein
MSVKDITIAPRSDSVPADYEAEMCVLGTLLNGSTVIAELERELDAELFFYPSSKTILNAILELHDRRDPIDIIVLSQILEDKGVLGEVGGRSVITELETTYRKTTEIARYEIEILTKLRAKRELLKLGSDLLGGARNGADVLDVARDAEKKISEIRLISETKFARKPVIEFKTPGQLKSFKPAPDAILVGDCHIVRGAVFVIGGAPGVGKSLATIELAKSGATGLDWFGLGIRVPFRTLIVQSENGSFRLSRDFAEVDCEPLEESVRICPPPPVGLCFEKEEFRDVLSREIQIFKPGVVIIDPWNAVARDERARDYLDTFKIIREVIPPGDNSPALGIVAHTRKPKAEERATGRGLLNLLAGSYVL